MKSLRGSAGSLALCLLWAHTSHRVGSSGQKQRQIPIHSDVDHTSVTRLSRKILILWMGTLMKKLLLIGAAFAVLLTPALAAENPVRVHKRVRPAVVAPPVYSWTGFYVGGNVGYGWGNARTDIAGGRYHHRAARLSGGVFQAIALPLQIRIRHWLKRRHRRRSDRLQLSIQSAVGVGLRGHTFRTPVNGRAMHLPIRSQRQFALWKVVVLPRYVVFAWAH